MIDNFNNLRRLRKHRDFLHKLDTIFSPQLSLDRSPRKTQCMQKSEHLTSFARLDVLEHKVLACETQFTLLTGNSLLV